MSAPPRRTPAARTFDALASPALTNLLGVIGVITPVAAWVTAQPGVKNLLITAETAIVLALVATHLWRQSRYITLPRTHNLKSMDDAHFYDLVRAQLERELVQEYDEIANGHLRVYASEVPGCPSPWSRPSSNPSPSRSASWRPT
ncbi:hypothetical protein GCM10010218_64050 [Streptomyces mashuensis]|uniref:Uncharacterized protein n=1 Tax=Streptomyces mashuensis TaxID=33904 RepID=A0A919B932_9ACTN|nr:hypothetical protein [Streptomyces mashuensis]GHF74111.1 hypothetical protein GCM10010218_64050 [Streptomyces mashuensis]